MAIIPPVKHKLGPIQLGVMLGSAIGLPSMIVGSQLAKQFGVGSALLSSFIGNMILWLIGLSIISMSNERMDAIENIKGYLGKRTGVIAAIILIPAFITWYALQIQGAVIPMANLFNTYLNSSQFFDLRLGVALGTIVTILSIGGMRIIKWTTMIGLPILFTLVAIIIFHANTKHIFKTHYDFSFYGILTILFTWLPGYINLPTFTRHSRSKADSYLALSIIAILHITFQSTTIIAQISNETNVIPSIFGFGKTLNIFLTVVLILTTFLCINLVNVYFASAGWDAIFPKWKGSYKYPIISLIGIITFLFYPFTTNSMNSPLFFTENVLTLLISNLGIVLIVNALIKVVVKHRPRNFVKFWNSICWLLGLFVALWFQIRLSDGSHYPLAIGASAILLAYLILCFIEETIWSIKNL